MTIFYKKHSAKSTNFEVSSLGNFDEISVSKFQPGLGLHGYGLDCITVDYTLFLDHSYTEAK